MAQYNQPLITSPYLDYQATLPVSVAGQIQVTPAGTIDWNPTQELEMTLLPRFEVEVSQYDMGDASSHFNTFTWF